LAPLALFEILNVPGASFVSQSNLVSLLNKVLTLVSNTIQSLKCMPIKQTTSLVGTRDIKLLPDYSSGINCFLQLFQVVGGRKNLFMLGNTNPITDQVEVNLLGIEDDIHPRTFHRMRNKMLLYDVS
jgi:hypothetical protein